MPFERAAKALQAQGIPRAPAGNPLAANAPWKRMDLHRLGQDDCERLGGIFYFRILFFNVRPNLIIVMDIIDLYPSGTLTPPQREASI